MTGSVNMQGSLHTEQPFLLQPMRSFRPSPELDMEIRRANETLPRLRAESRIAREKLGWSL
jgi:hypothetical protein